MKPSALIGLLGGTFDPIHNGHLHIATELLKRHPFDQIRLLPCYSPVHRKAPQASPEDRLAMTKLACEKLPKIIVDEHEIKRGGPSYMIDTLSDLKKETPSNHYCLIIGQDAFNSFDQWHQWESILNYCHLIVVNRPNTPKHYPQTLKKYTQAHEAKHFSSLEASANGCIYFSNIHPLAISATHLREAFSHGKIIENTIPEAVLSYILKLKLYQH